MSNISEKEWRIALTSILEELEKPQYRKMLEFLEIPRGQRRENREKMPGSIIQHFGLEKSISEINSVMDQIPRRDPTIQNLLRPFVEKLRIGQKTENQGQQKSCQPVTEKNTHWKKSIREVNSSGLLKTEGFLGKIIQKSGLRTYRTKEKEEKFFFYLAVADETDSVKVMVYGKDRYQEIEEGSSYLFTKLMIDEKGVKVTNLSTVSRMKSVFVPEKLETEARKLIYVESPLYSIREAKSLDDRTEVSVEGTVTDLSPVGTTEVKDRWEKRKKQNFELQDDTDSIDISMWGDATDQCEGLSVGDVIKVINVKTHDYYGSVSLNSTGFTRILKIHHDDENSAEREKDKMSLKALETKWKPALASILAELSYDQFRMVLFHLNKIPLGKKEDKPREDIPYLIIQYYGPEGSIIEIDKIMKRIPRMDADIQGLLRPFVEKLKKQVQKNKETTSKPPGAKKPKFATDQLKSVQPDKFAEMSPFGFMQPEPKIEKQEWFLNRAEYTQPSKVQSAPVQTGWMRILRIKSNNKTNTHLEVEFNGRLQTVFVTTRLLENTFGFKVEEECLVDMLMTEAKIQGNKIIELRWL